MGSDSILITGASGLLGASLVMEFSARGKTIAAQYLDHEVRFPFATNVKCNLTVATAVQELIEQVRPAWVIHCAAATNVDWCEQNRAQCQLINVEGTRNVAQAVQRIGSRILYISTDAVFDGKSGGYSELSATGPVNFYAKSKLEGERLVTEQIPSAIVVRTNIFGFHPQTKHAFAEWILGQLRSGNDVPGFSDVTFSPLLVNDMAPLLSDLMAADCRGVYHLGSRDHCSKYEFAALLAHEFGFNEERIRRTSADQAVWVAQRPRHTWLQTEKATRSIRRDLPSVREAIGRLKHLATEGFPAALRAACTAPAGIAPEA